MKAKSIALFVGINFIIMAFFAVKATKAISTMEHERVKKVNELYDYLGR